MIDLTAILYPRRRIPARLSKNVESIQLPDSKDEILALIGQLSGIQLDQIKSQVCQTYANDKQFYIDVCEAINKRRDQIKLEGVDASAKKKMRLKQVEATNKKIDDAYLQKHPIQIIYTPMGGQNGKTHH